MMLKTFSLVMRCIRWFAPGGMFGGSRAYAEYVSVPMSEVALKPAGIDHVQAAGAPMSLLTAWQFMVDLGHDEPNPLQSNRHQPVPLEGKTVLVNGVAGGVGLCGADREVERRAHHRRGLW